MMNMSWLSAGGKVLTGTCAILMLGGLAGAEVQWEEHEWSAAVGFGEGPGGIMIYAAEGKAVAMDGAENAYVLGEASTDRNTDAMIYKYNRNTGAVAWFDIHNHAVSGGDYSYDTAGDIASDTAGNAYVAIRSGREGIPQANHRVVVRKYGAAHSTGSSPAWTYVYESPDDGDAEPHAIALDASGNCYVAGEDYGGGLLFKVNNNGTAGSVLVRQESDDPGGWVRFFDVALDASGSIYVAGQAQRDENGEVVQENIVAKYNSSGVLQWLTYYDGNITVGARSVLALSPDGQAVYAAGVYVNPAHRTLWCVVRLRASDGLIQWNDKYGGSDASGPSEPTSIAVDSAGDVLVAGSVANTGTGYDLAVVKYQGSPALNRLWEASYSGDDPARWQTAVGVGTDSRRNVYMSGWVKTPKPPDEGSYDVFTTVKYAPDGGEPTSVFHYQHMMMMGETSLPVPVTASAMDVAPSGAVAVTGQGPVMSDMVTVLYPGASGREVGDFNGDGVTDFADFLFLLEHWGEAALGDPPMGFADFLALLENWT